MPCITVAFTLWIGCMVHGACVIYSTLFFFLFLVVVGFWFVCDIFQWPFIFRIRRQHWMEWRRLEPCILNAWMHLLAQQTPILNRFSQHLKNVWKILTKTIHLILIPPRTIPIHLMILLSPRTIPIHLMIFLPPRKVPIHLILRPLVINVLVLN